MYLLTNIFFRSFIQCLLSFCNNLGFRASAVSSNLKIILFPLTKSHQHFGKRKGSPGSLISVSNIKSIPVLRFMFHFNLF